MSFFEDVGMLLRRRYVDREMIWDSFGYYARMWWSASKDWIMSERSEDITFFADFEKLVEFICEEDAKRLNKSRAGLEPSAPDLKNFLESEARAEPKLLRHGHKGLAC